MVIIVIVIIVVVFLLFRFKNTHEENLAGVILHEFVNTKSRGGTAVSHAKMLLALKLS